MTDQSPTPILSIRGLCKSYGVVPVLHDVSLDIYPGEIVALTGENGAGKSTLAKCINGITQITAGEIKINGTALTRPSPALAQELGVVTIPQEFDLIQGLSVAENIFLGREPSMWGGFIRKGEMNRQAAHWLSQLDSTLPPETPVERLSVAEKQFVEIAKAISRRCKVLILDESTTVLNRREAERLFGVMRRLKAEGTALIFVSHKLHEIRQICDRIITLRDGRLVSDTPAAGVDEAEMARRMVGRDVSELYPPMHYAEPAAPVLLQVEGVASTDGKVRDVSFTLRKGEIIGFAGLAGAGRTELAECLYGIRQVSNGRILLEGKEMRFKDPAAAVAAGVAYLSEDRQASGILGGFSVAANTTLISLKRYCHPLISRSEESRCAQEYIQRFSIKCNDQETLLSELSGGNQQKVAIAKGLDTSPRLFIFDEPTRGIDVSARSEVYAFIHRLLAEGIACIMISSDLEEVLGMCPRVAVMHDGVLKGILEGAERTEENVMYLATGIPAQPTQNS